MEDYQYDYLYEVWRRGGDPDAVDLEDIPRDFDWVYDAPLPEHFPQSKEDSLTEEEME